MIVPLPAPLAWLQARLMEFLPAPPMSRDNLRSLQLPSVCAAGCSLPFGRQAAALETIAPGYLRAV
jgi:NADH dehydrogenase